MRKLSLSLSPTLFLSLSFFALVVEDPRLLQPVPDPQREQREEEPPIEHVLGEVVGRDDGGLVKRGGKGGRKGGRESVSRASEAIPCVSPARAQSKIENTQRRGSLSRRSSYALFSRLHGRVQQPPRVEAARLRLVHGQAIHGLIRPPHCPCPRPWDPGPW